MISTSVAPTTPVVTRVDVATPPFTTVTEPLLSAEAGTVTTPSADPVTTETAAVTPMATSRCLRFSVIVTG